MKLAIISPGFVPAPAVKGGAVEKLIEYFIDGNEKDHKYDIDLYTVDDILLENKKYKYTKLIRVKNKQKKFIYKVFYALANRISNFLNINKHYSYVESKFIKKYKLNYYDAILIENNMDIYKKIYPKLKKEKIYFHLHNDIDCGDPAKTKEKTNFILKTADKIFVVSYFLKNKLVNLKPSEASKIKVVYNGVISRNFKKLSKEENIKLKEKYQIKNNDIIFSFVGRFDANKGIDKLIKALKELKNVPNLKCLLIGDSFFGTKAEGKYINSLKNEALAVKDKLIFTGYIENEQLYKLYSISDCVVIPSQWEEVFGVVALEAMTMGKPVIASISGGLPEVLSKDCALFVKRDKNFVKNLSNAMRKMYTQPALRKLLGENGKKRSKEFPTNEKDYYETVSQYIE